MTSIRGATSASIVLFCFCVMVAAWATALLRAQEKPILVFAAVSLKDALEPIAEEFSKDTGREVVFSFAASSQLARQIAAGAPADLFISADVDWVAWLQVQNLTIPETQKIIAQNKLVLVGPEEATISATDVTHILMDWFLNDTRRIAVADPEHVPAGRYARSALKALEDEIGPYDAYEKRFAIGGNVRLAALLVARGEVPLGIVYHSDAIVEPRIKVLASFAPESHAKIVYPIVTLIKADPGAENFVTFLTSQAAHKHLKKVGLSLPMNGL